MGKNKIHIPYGVKDYLIEECNHKKTTEETIKKTFLNFSYDLLEPPMFEYLDVFEGKGTTELKQMYKLIDKDGEILALRPDFTPQIARIVATKFDKTKIPFRFCYSGNVFRYNEDFEGKLREFTQAGAELIGINTIEADTEIVSLAINTLKVSKLKDFRLYLGHVDFLDGMLAELGTLKEKIETALILKNFVEFENIVSNFQNEELKKKLLMLPSLVGSFDIIEKAKHIASNQKSLNALNMLEKIYFNMKQLGLEKYIYFDLLGMTSKLKYYTGLIITGYGKDIGMSILTGGRYDNLIAKYGSSLPAVGFSIKINELTNLLVKQDTSLFKGKEKVLLVYEQRHNLEAKYISKELIKKGLVPEISFFSGKEKNIKYANKKQIKKIIFLVDNNVFQIFDTEKETTQEILKDGFKESIKEALIWSI